MFSIIIPLFNKRESIVATIQSVLAQECHCNFEVIIVNDGSTDGSENCIYDIQDSRIKLFSIPNSGPSFARNYGVKHSQYNWILFLDADDILLPNALLSFEYRIKRNPRINIFAGNFIVSGNNSVNFYSLHYSERTINWPNMLWFFRRLETRAGSFVVKREALLQEPFNNQIRRYEDADVCFRLFQANKVYRFPDPVMIYKTDCSSASKPRKTLSEDYLGHLTLERKSFWGRMNIYDLYLQALSRYPEESTILYSSWNSKLVLQLSFRLMRKIRTVFLCH